MVSALLGTRAEDMQLANIGSSTFETWLTLMAFPAKLESSWGKP